MTSDLRPPNPSPSRFGFPTALLLGAGAGAPLLAWTLSVAAALTWPGYDPVAQSISLLVHGPNGWLQTIAFLASGGLGLAWAVGMGRVLGTTGADQRRVRWLLALQSGLAIAFAAFPTDPGVRGSSPVGLLHLATFGLYAIAMPVSLVLIARVMRRDGRWAGGTVPTRVAGGLLAACLALVPVTLYGPLLPWLGLLERIYVAIPSIWEVAVAVAGLRLINRAWSGR
jgi:hypothetical protein